MKDLWTHRKFALKLLAFAVVFFVINIPVNNAYTRWSRQNFDYEISRKQFEAALDQISLVFIGDSHVGVGVDATMFEGGHNFAINGENAIEEYYKYKYYLDRGWKPEVAVIQVDLHTFSGFKSDRFYDPAFWKQYIDYLELGLLKGEPQTYLIERLIGEFAYMGDLENAIQLFIKPKKPKNIVSGSFLEGIREFSEHNDSKKQEMSATRAARHFEESDYLDSDLLTYFLRLVDLLEAHQVEVVLVSYPVTEWYYEEAEKYFSAEEYYNDIEEGLAENGNQVVILEYLDIFLSRDDLFLDSDHLNAEGAAQFTARFKDDLEALGVYP